MNKDPLSEAKTENSGLEPSVIRGGIIDAHVHMFPPEIYNHWQHYAGKDPWFELLTKAPAHGRGVQEVWSDGPETLACMKAAGVSEIIMQGWYFNDFGLLRMHNDYMAELMAQYPGIMHGYIATNPVFGDKMLYEIERCKALGFKGIGELGPGGNGYDFVHPALESVIRCAEQEKLPVCIHCGEAVSHTYPGKDETPLGPLAELIRAYPGVRFLLAHLGGGLPFFEMGKRYRKHFQNVFYDTAAVPLLYDMRILRHVMDLVGKDRLIFGSDFPLTLYPGQFRTRDMKQWVTDSLCRGDFDIEEAQAFGRDNAERLLNIGD